MKGCKKFKISNFLYSKNAVNVEYFKTFERKIIISGKKLIKISR